MFITVFIYSCDDSINQPTENAFLDIVVSVNDSLLIEFDNEVIVNKRLVYFGGLGYSWFKRYKSIKVGIHKVRVIVFDNFIEAERKFYLEDTLALYISYFPDLGKKIKITTENHEFYGE